LSKRRIVVFGVLLGVVVIGGVAAVAAWKYHEQPQFCGTCHIMDPYLESWQASDLGAHAHAVEDVTCLDCHEPTVQQQVDELVVYMQGDFEVPLKERDFGVEFCFDCHVPNEHTSYEQIIERTKDFTDYVVPQQINPHDPHAGLEEMGPLKCIGCHQMHEESRLINGCDGCHHDGTFESCSTCHPGGIPTGD